MDRSFEKSITVYAFFSTLLSMISEHSKKNLNHRYVSFNNLKEK